jgi:cell division protein FtsZ
MTVSVLPQPIIRTPIEARLPILKVLGMGGAGCNAVNRMIELGIPGVDFIAANTDCQVLQSNLALTHIQLGPKLTRGLGAGGNPSTGEAAAEESYRELNAALTGADMVFLAAGMGGGTGTGSISVAAKVARAAGAIVVAVVSTPFSFEAGRRQQNAREGLSKLRPFTDTLITIPNDRLLSLASPELPLELAFRLADDVLRQGIQGISELITQPGTIHVDFAHIRNFMQNGQGAILSMGIGQGEGKATKAIENALHHPLLDSIEIENANGILCNFTGGSDLAFMEVTEAMNFLQKKTNEQAEIIPGVVYDPRMTDRAQVIMVITGIGGTSVDHDKSIPQDSIPVYKSAQIMELNDPVDHTVINSQGTLDRRSNLDIPAFLRRRIR